MPSAAAMADRCEEEGEDEEEVDDEEEGGGVGGGTALEDAPSQVCFILHSGSSKALKGAENTPTKTSHAGIKRKRGSKHEFLLPLPPCIVDEPPECGLWRAEAFQSTWEKIEESVKDVFKSRNMKVFKEIYKYVHNSIFCDAQLQLYLSPMSSSSARVSKQLNAALLYLRNVDSSDHTSTFIELNSYLQNNNCHVANLLPQNFSGKGGMGSALYSMLKQIVKINPDTADMDVLASWHRKPENVKLPIVIIIEDAELCNAEVLADFIITLSEWLAQLPLVLILGMATSVDAMRRLLPASAARRLHVHTFTLPSPNEYLEGVIKATLFNPTILFDICCDTLKFLISYYEKYDSTVTSFLRALKMACMEHFWSQPLSFLCTKIVESNQTRVEDSLDSVKGILLQYASDLPSVKSMKFDANHDIHKELAAAVGSLREQRRRWCTTLHCLLAAAKLLSLDSIKIISEVLEIQTQKTLSQEFITSKGDGIQWGYSEQNGAIATLFKRIRDASELTMHKMLTKLMKRTENSKEWRNEVQAMLQKFMSETPIDEGFLNDSEKTLRRKKLLFEASREKQPKIALDEIPIEDESKVKEILTKNATVDCSNTNRETQAMPILDYEAVLTRAGGSPVMQKKLSSRVIGKMVANFIEKMMKECLITLDSLPFHEIICFRNAGNIKQTLIGEPRKAIQRNVQYPQITLQCNCCCINNGNLSDSMNDSSILFCLAQTHGDQVNLFEVYQSFSAVLETPISEEPCNKRKSQKSPKKTVEKMDRALLQARFCKAASELQMVGLFHMPSKKRPDFVQLAI